MGYIKHVCKISGSISQKRRGYWTLKEVRAISLNQPVVEPDNLWQKHSISRMDHI